MLGSRERGKHLKRARPKSSASLRPCVPDSLKSIRCVDRPRYVRRLVQFFQSSACLCHPKSDIGWWCCYEEEMKDLITFLSEPQSDHPESWSAFRENVSTQISLCRQCAIAYHKAVNEWELGNEVADWRKDVVRKRVTELLEWDASRLIPAIEKGAVHASSSDEPAHLSDDPDTLGRRAQCREAFLESLLSLRLCMNEKFCKVLGEVFLTRSPARNHEDFTPFIKSHGVIPPGVTALCFHPSKQVRMWARTVYLSCRSDRPADQQAMQLLISKGLRLAISRASGEGHPVKSAMWAPDSQCIWEGLDVLLTSMSAHELESMMKRHKKFPIMEAIFVSLSNAGSETVDKDCQGLAALLDILRYVLLSIPFASLFGSCLTPEKLLDAVFRCFKVRSGNSCERHLLLDMMFTITSTSTRRSNKFDSRRLFVKCFDFLEGLELFQRGMAHSSRQLDTLDVVDIGNSRDHVLSTSARLLLKFYWYSWPKLPVDDSRRIADFVTNVVRGIPSRECAWDLLRNVLLTDVFNLVRCIYGPREVEMIAATFFSFHAEARSTAERRSLPLENAIQVISQSKASLTWVEDLWKNVRRGCHVSDENQRSEKIYDFEMSLLLDLHRLVGVLDPQRCGDLVRDDMFEPSQSLRRDKGVTQCFADLISQRMETVHRTIVSRMQMIPDLSENVISIRELPFHAAHLLSSSCGEVSRQSLVFLQRRCKIQNATYAKPQSRDKVLVHILKQDKNDSRMIFDGFMSATRIKSAEGAAISARAFPSFFRWYSLLASKDCPILRDREIAKGVLGVLLSFIEDWKTFEFKKSMETFRETVCRLFSVIPNIWDALCDIEERPERSKANVDHYDKDVSLWTRKVAMKLLTMHDLKDDAARAAWVRMITNDKLKSALKNIDSCRGVLIGIISEHATRRGPLEYVHCRKLAEAFDLEEVNGVLDRWTLKEAGRAASRTANGITTKKYRETKIDSFFRARLCSNKPLDVLEESPASTLREKSKDSHLQMRMTAAQKRHMGHCSMASGRINGSLRDLRRDHRQARAEQRRTVSTYETVAASREPAKTRFELLREERIAEKRRKKSQVADDGNMVHLSEMCLEEFSSQECMDHIRCESAKESMVTPVDSHDDLISDEFCYPTAHRGLQTRCVEKIKRDVLMSQDPLNFEVDMYTSPPPDTFDSVESYAKYWEPLLISEFYAGIRKKVDEERMFAEQNKRKQEDIGCRMVFEVDGPAENIGYLHTLSITGRPRGDAALQGHNSMGASPFDISSVQVSDIVMIIIPVARELQHTTREKTTEMLFAIVSTVLRAKGGLRLTLRVVFDNISAPGKGRLVKVSKLLSFTTLQRQLDALWSLPKIQDGILWSLLDPVEGWRIKQDLEARDEVVIDQNSSLPLQVIQKMESLGVLNASQGRAITDVVRSCSGLFAARGGTRPQYAKDDHGGMSLIQGPPGTGKTTTIIALLSALLSCLGSNPYRRKAKVVLDGTPHILSIPAIRILVCAPSNAAIDELMLRVMNDGLFTASENRVCPRLVRVGRGATVESLQALELHCLSKSGEEHVRSKESVATTSDKDHRKLLEEVNRQIGELDGDRRKISSQLDKTSNGIGTTPGMPKSDTERFRDIGERLRILHDKKKVLQSILTHERETERKEEASRKRENIKIVCNILATASVVFATLSSSGHEDMKSLGGNFDVVIIDEAGQSCEPETLIPITLGQRSGSPKQRSTHTVLVGDPRQLPATVISNNRRVATAMGRSLFERIGLNVPSIVHLLDIQYRMHPKISSFPSDRFYDGRICNSADVKSKNMHRVWHLDKQKRFGPLTFFDTAQTTKEIRSHGGSLSNDKEAKLVIEGLISMVKLYRTEDLLNQIVILSPYKQQVTLLKKLVSSNTELQEAKVEVSTIDGIQGREKSVILLSTVRSGHSRDIGFVKDDRRLNVALTRAKHTLMIFGHAEFLSAHSDAWAALVAHCTRNSRMVSLPVGCDTLFPELRQGAFYSQKAEDLSQTDHISDSESAEPITVLPADQMDLRETTSASGAQVDQSARAVDLGGKVVIRKQLSKEADYGRLRTNPDGKNHGKLAQHRDARLQNRIMVKRSIAPNKSEDRCKRSLQQKDAYNSNNTDLKPRLPVSQPGWQLHRGEQKDGKPLGHPIHHGSSDAGGKQSFPLNGLPKTTIIATTQRPQVDVLKKTRAYPPLAHKPFISDGRDAPKYGERVLSGEHCPRGVRTPSRVGTQKQPQGHATRRSAGSYNVAPKQTKVSATTTLIKRSYSSRGSDSVLRNEPPNKRSRLEKGKHRKQGAERRNATSRGRWSHEQSNTNSYITQRRAVQTNPTSQSRKQISRRLVTHHQHQSRSRQNRRRDFQSANLDLKGQSQTKRSRATPAFSLSDTQTKLKGTLDAARVARSTGTHR